MISTKTVIHLSVCEIESGWYLPCHCVTLPRLVSTSDLILVSPWTIITAPPASDTRRAFMKYYDNQDTYTANETTKGI